MVSHKAKRFLSSISWFAEFFTASFQCQSGITAFKSQKYASSNYFKILFNSFQLVSQKVLISASLSNSIKTNTIRDMAILSTVLEQRPNVSISLPPITNTQYTTWSHSVFQILISICHEIIQPFNSSHY